MVARLWAAAGLPGHRESAPDVSSSCRRADYEARRGVRALALTRTEFHLLELFLQRPGRLLHKDQLVSHLCGWGEEVSTNAIEVYVHRLRKKLDGASPGSNLINTVRNGGYLFTAHVRPLT